MQNKANGNARPCLVAFQDKNMNDIYWCIPISSQVEKYDSIYKKKIQNQINKGIKNPKCDTICFGNVLGKRRAFLIQNMFPVSKEYISNIYVVKENQKKVQVSENIKNDIIIHAKKALKAAKRNPEILYTDVNKLYSLLEKEQQLHKEKFVIPETADKKAVPETTDKKAMPETADKKKIVMRENLSINQRFEMHEVSNINLKLRDSSMRNIKKKDDIER